MFFEGDKTMDLTSLTSLIDTFMFIIKFFCWLDNALGLGLIPDEFCAEV